jgi:putative FmdB family regulatory protein
MPTYEYRCRDCGEPLEVVQSFRDEPLSVCPACGGSLRKIFGNVGIAFKGSGFYKTDSRSSSGSKSSVSSESGSAGSSSSGDTSGDTKSSETKSDAKSSETKSDSGSKSSDGASSASSNGSSGSSSKSEKAPA